MTDPNRTMVAGVHSGNYLFTRGPAGCKGQPKQPIWTPSVVAAMKAAIHSGGSFSPAEVPQSSLIATCASGSAPGPAGFSHILESTCSHTFSPGETEFWVPEQVTGPFSGPTINYFHGICHLYTPPYGDSSGGTNSTGGVIDPLAPADQNFFYGMTNHQAASMKFPLHIQWSVAYVPPWIHDTHPDLYGQEQIVYIWNGPGNSGDAWGARDSGDPNFLTIPPAGDSFIMVPNFSPVGAIHMGKMVRIQGSPGILGDIPLLENSWRVTTYLNIEDVTAPDGTVLGGLPSANFKAAVC